MADLIVINERDNVANAVADISGGTTVVYSAPGGEAGVKAISDIPFGFKMAIAKIPRGGPVVKYGEVIGEASEDINAGELVHVHNVEGRRGRGDLNG